MDSPDTLHHVMEGEPEPQRIVRDDTDRMDLVACVAALAESGARRVYAWAPSPITSRMTYDSLFAGEGRVGGY